jgi:aminopeptidase N
LANYELGGQAAYDQFMSKKRRSIRYKKPMVIGDDLSEDEIYSGGDIYTKGAFFMHTLRYVIGDEIFLPTLKKLATDPQYTYDNFVNTDDVEKLFSTESKQNLKPLFDLYTRTTDQIDITVREVDFQKYLIKVNNYFMDLPFDITSSEGTKRMMIGKDVITVISTTPPIVDGKGYYLKKVSMQ